MAITQLSILITNEVGSLAEVTGIFWDNDIDVRAISVSDTTEYGILRVVVDNPDKAVNCLKEKGIVAKKSEVLAINPEDKKGSLTSIFKIMSENNINIDYIYSFVVREKEEQYFVLKVGNISHAEMLLEYKGIEVIKK
ncbi:MAG: ACT domain-containing protein [Aminipila sp.]